MINNGNKTVTEVLNGFLYHKGRASCRPSDTSVVPEIIYSTIANFRNKHKDKTVLIVVNKSDDARELHNKLLKFNPKFKEEFNVLILSLKFAFDTDFSKSKLIIGVNVEKELDVIDRMYHKGTFVLNIIRPDDVDAYILDCVRNYFPNIRLSENHTSANRNRIGTPVEEECIPCQLDDDDAELNNKYSEFITSCVVRFGTFDNIAYSRTGNPKRNKSAAEIREEIALYNGWSYNLDVNNPYQKAIDDAYNPNVLKDLAESFYNISRKRRDMLTDNKCKIPVIIDIIKKHPEKRIAIVCQRGEFANEVEKVINNELGYIACLGYHDDLEPAYMRDDKGEYIRYKSGENKGELKLFKAKALQGSNLASFQAGEVNILCLKNSSSSTLSATFDVVIFTSSICSDIIEFKKRYNRVTIDGVPNKTYRLYASGTIEENKLMSMRKYSNVNQIKPEINLTTIDEDTGDIML